MTSILALTLLLHIQNLAGAPPAIVDAAAAELTRVYAAFGVAIDHDTAGARRDAVRVILLKDETGALRRASESVMGAAVRTPGGAGVVYVFYDRVRAEAERYEASTALVLACAIEHELGHLLGSGHSRDGVMRRTWRADDFRSANQGQLRFSADQVALIRSGR